MKINVNNIATEYLDQGTGPVVLMLHGWQDNLHTFDALAATLIATHRVIRLDLPGFGQTEHVHTVWGVDEYVHFIQACIRKLDVSVDVLVGHSFGGRLVLQGIATQQVDPRIVVLIASAGVVKARSWRNRLLATVARMGRLVTTWPIFARWKKQLRRRLYAMIGSDYFFAGPMKDTYRRVSIADVRTVAPLITRPILLLWGADDTYTPLSDGQTLHQLLRRSTLTVYDSVGHFVHRERPVDVAAAIRTYAALPNTHADIPEAAPEEVL